MSYYDHATLMTFRLGPWQPEPRAPFDRPAPTVRTKGQPGALAGVVRRVRDRLRLRSAREGACATRSEDVPDTVMKPG